MRTYKPRPTYRRSRQRSAAELRGAGLSLRQIAAKVGASHETVRRDLAAWDAQQAKVSHLPVTFLAPGVEVRDTGCDSPAAVVLPLRRLS
jgi:hypothetical protein